MDLPDLTDPHEVPAAAVTQFRDEGHALVRGLASVDEVGAFRPAIEAAVREHSRETRPLEERDTYSKAFLQVTNLWRHDEAARRFVFSPRFARVAADLLGVEGVRLYHDQALFKEAGGGRTPFHQDQFYWPFDSDKTITMWMPLVPVTSDIGSMSFAAGSHKLGYLGEFAISDEGDAAFREVIAEREIPLVTHGALAPGDATFHAGWTLHRAAQSDGQPAVGDDGDLLRRRPARRRAGSSVPQVRPEEVATRREAGRARGQRYQPEVVAARVVSIVRKRVVVRGRVQGVFFRESCRREAAIGKVAGSVRNTMDGCVEAAFEGEELAVGRLVRWCGTGSSQAVVTAVEVIDEAPIGEAGFRIW